MKILLISLSSILTINFSIAQSTNNQQQVEAACMDYIEGFYEGDTTKLARSIMPRLNKFGFWKNKETGVYEMEGYMTFEQAINYAKSVKEKGRFAKPDAPKAVQVLDVMNTTACAKVTAWWGTDYILLSKQDDTWMIEQVIWEGPLEK